MLADYDDNTARAGLMVAHSTGARWWTEGPGTLRAQGGGTDPGGHLVVTPTLTAGMGTNHGAPGHGGKDEAVLAVTAATLQGGGRRGHRVDSEAAAGNHLVVAGTGRSHPRPCSADPGAVTVAHSITAREGKGPDSDAVSGFIAVPVALRGRAAGAQVEAGEPGDPAFTVRTPGGGSSYPMVATTLAAGTAAGEGVNAPGRRHEDDYNLIAHTLTSEGADASEDGTGRGTPLAVVPAAPLAPQGDTQAVRRLTPMECERLQGFPDRWTLIQAGGTEQSDSARYRQLGNAVAVPCVAWITRRIVAAEAHLSAVEGAA